MFRANSINILFFNKAKAYSISMRNISMINNYQVTTTRLY